MKRSYRTALGPFFDRQLPFPDRARESVRYDVCASSGQGGRDWSEWMSDAYESGYRKIASLDQLVLGRPAVFRAAGAAIVLRLDERGVEAIDGSCLAERGELTADDRVRKILDCVAAGVGLESSDWSELVRKAGLPVRIESDSVWVCVDGCSK